MIISKRDKNQKRTAAGEDSDFMKNLLGEIGGVESSPSPEVKSANPSVESEKLAGDKRYIKNRYSSLGQEYVSDEIINSLTEQNIDSYKSLIEFVLSLQQEINDAKSEIQELDLAAAEAERSGKIEEAQQKKSEAVEAHAKLLEYQDAASKAPEMIANWKAENIK